MYSHYPPPDRARVKTATCIAWLICAAAGVAIVIDPGWAATVTAPWAIIGGGALLTIASLGAIITIVLSKYRAERPLSWLAFVGATPYVVTAWWILIVEPFPPAIPSLKVAILSTLLLSHPLIRSLFGLAYSNRLRAENRLLQTLSTGDVEVQPRADDKGE